MNKNKPKIFLSYAREDMGMAKRLYNDLKRYNLDVWLDTESLLPGDRWKDKIQDAIENSNYFIALLSTTSVNKKGFVQKELKTALEVLDLFPNSERFILPVRLDDCEICERKLKEHHWVDLFPDGEYQGGLRKILKVVSPGMFLLRSKPMKITRQEVIDMIRSHSFYDEYRNPAGKGFSHNYKLKEINGDEIICDEFSCLMWQRSGSDNRLKHKDAENWLIEINRKGFAGFNDWRLPTLEEAMSLVEPEKKNGLYIDPIFEIMQEWIWTSDLEKDESAAWVVYFYSGECGPRDFVSSYVRAVRSGQSSKE